MDKTQSITYSIDLELGQKDSFIPQDVEEEQEDGKGKDNLFNNQGLLSLMIIFSIS